MGNLHLWLDWYITTDIVILGREHAVVLGMVFGKPVMSADKGFKFKFNRGFEYTFTLQAANQLL